MASQRERISHAIRRLGIGAHGDRVAELETVEEAIDTALDLSAPTPPLPEIEPPRDVDAAREPEQRREAVEYWWERLVSSDRMIEERLVWFWHDHFATSIRKVRFPYLMWQQHLTIRTHATGNFGDLLHAIARDPAMLIYLDGTDNSAGAINENFGREVMELFMVGRGAFSEDDVLACARACSGWVVYLPRPARETDQRRPIEVLPWASVFVPWRHDSGQKTLFGVTADLDMTAAMDILLERPETSRFVGAKLYTELVGSSPDPATTERLAAAFTDYDIMSLVEAIVAEPAFLDESSIQSRVRTPLERVVGAVQGFGDHSHTTRAAAAYLETVGYLPWVPPNVAGFPEGSRLLGPHTLMHGFDAALAVGPDVPDLDSAGMLARLGLYDVSDTTRGVLEAAREPAVRLMLALNSPEYALT